MSAECLSISHNTNIKFYFIFVDDSGSSDSACRKRALDFSSDAVCQPDKPQKQKQPNDLWNSIYCSLVRDLEKKGTKDRYGVKHLKLWTDEILEGRSSGVGEEPLWQNFISQVGVPPKPSRGTPKPSSPPSTATSTPTTTDDLLKAMFIQNQQRMEIESRRAEVFQNTMMAMMTASSPVFQQKVPIIFYKIFIYLDSWGAKQSATYFKISRL